MFLAIIFTRCKKDNDPRPVYNLEQLYASAVTDAMVADSPEVIDMLQAIRTDNPGLQWKTINGQQKVRGAGDYFRD